MGPTPRYAARPMNPLTEPLWAGLAAEKPWLEQAVTAVRQDRAQLPVLFPGLPRRMGRGALGGGLVRLGHGEADLDAWRLCDAAAALLLIEGQATAAELRDLYAHGDLEERTMLLRALHALEPFAATVDLLGEVQRTNMVVHVEAACCDGDLLARLREAGLPGFGQAEQNRLMLKIAFLDLPLRRVHRGESMANAALSQMLMDLATEREAAGRPIWRDTDRMLGRAPVPGTTARILGGLEHGDDHRRLAAAEGLIALGRADLRAFAQERLGRESRADIRALLQQIAG